MTKLEEVANAIMGPSGLKTADALICAKRAIEALREPNTAMIEGGEALTHWSGTGSGCYCDHHAEPERMWPAMVDAILAEKPEGA